MAAYACSKRAPLRSHKKGYSHSLGKCGLTPDWQVCVRIAIGLARSITESTEPLCCAPYGRHTLIRCAHPSGQPFGCYSASLRFLAPAPLRGRLIRAIPGPLSGAAIGISPHPCGSSPYAPPPLGLLTGPERELARFPRAQAQRRLFLLFALELRSYKRRPCPLQEAEWNHRGRG